MPELTPTLQPGDVITAAILNELIGRKTQPLTVRTSPGMYSRSSEGHLQLGLKVTKGFFKGKVAGGGITARASDASHGTGTVSIWEKNINTGNWSDTSTTQEVDYISSTTGGLAAGVWVNCMYRSDGGADIISVDCAN